MYSVRWAPTSHRISNPDHRQHRREDVPSDGPLAALIHDDLEEERVAALEDDYVPVP